MQAMRIAIVSDVHSNIEALDAVFAHAGAIDGAWCLGDITGYGPDPSAVIARLRREALTAVAGNHDLAVCARMGLEEFNAHAAEAARWNAHQVSVAERAFLHSLPLVEVAADFTLAHGSIARPEWEYLLSGEQALTQFELQTTLVSIVGHSHLPFWCEETEGTMPLLIPAGDGDFLELEGPRLILNPGSVGQPRDGDPRASYILYDDRAKTVTWHRVEYDIAATQSKMREAGLPRWLSERLAEGR